MKDREWYDHVTGNDPVIHCNRFPCWWELSKKQQKEWLKDNPKPKKEKK